MTLRRPRRIFRGSHRPGRGGPSAAQAIVAGLLGIVIGATAILLMLPGDLFGRVPSPDGILQAEPQDVAVIDGQTLSLRRTSVRLLGVAAPARGEFCHAGSGTAFDCGATAAGALAAIVRGRPLTCRLQGRDGQGFAQASCLAGDTDVNRAIVLAGWARAQQSGAAGAPFPLAGAEQAARGARRGLWGDVAAPAL